MQLNTGEEYPVLQSDVDKWRELYPAVDVMQCLRNMKGWRESNPNKRKTVRGIKKFITSWLQKEQDRGGTAGYIAYNKQVSNGYGNITERLLSENRSYLP